MDPFRYLRHLAHHPSLLVSGTVNGALKEIEALTAERDQAVALARMLAETAEGALSVLKSLRTELDQGQEHYLSGLEGEGD